MTKRYRCQFNNCNCLHFNLFNNNLCLNCNHANVWHSRYKPPSSDGYLSFVSSRSFARKPEYEKRYIIEILEPSVPPLPESDNELEYCSANEILPF